MLQSLERLKPPGDWCARGQLYMNIYFNCLMISKFFYLTVRCHDQDARLGWAHLGGSGLALPDDLSRLAQQAQREGRPSNQS